MRRDSFLSFPKEIYSEGQLLPIYRSKFPWIVKDYQKLATAIYRNPSCYEEVAQTRATALRETVNKLSARFRAHKSELEELLKICLELQRAYAHTNWLICYALNEGPMSDYYIARLKELVGKLYLDKEEQAQVVSILLRTDYQIFYQKILADSVSIRDLIRKSPDLEPLAFQIKDSKKKDRPKLYGQLLKQIESRHEDIQRILKLYYENAKMHKSNKPLYNLLDEAIFNYQQNLAQLRKSIQVKRQIREILKNAEEKRIAELKEVYTLLRSMIKASDSTFGRVHLKLYPFWRELINRIVYLAEKRLRRKLSPEEGSWDYLPWSLQQAR